MRQRRKTVRRKLTELILGTCFCVLTVVLLGLAAFEVHSYRQNMARSLSTMAEIVAENSSYSILFRDEKLAQDVLGSLRAESEVSAAALFDREGRLYVTYPKTVARASFPSTIEPEGVTLRATDLTVWQPVMQGGSRVGTIYLKGSLRGTYQRLALFTTVVLLVGVAAAAIALALSQLLQRRISQPLDDLATSARRVSAEGDFSVRAAKVSDDEFGDLTDALNAMLDRIQAGSVLLREQEERFRTLADNMVQLAWMADATGAFQWFNKRWHDYSGLDVQESTQNAWATVHPEHRARLQQELGACFESGREWTDTFPIRGADGTYRWFLSHAIPIRNSEGKVLRWFGTNTDITELRTIQQDLRRTRDEALAASQAKDEFLAKLSHELRTPLNPVLLLVSDHERNSRLPDEVREDFESIRNNIELEARLIDDLLDLTAIVQGKLVLHRSIVSINALVREAFAKVAGDADKRFISVKSQLDPADPLVDCDPVRVQQALWNVLRNAVKFSRDGGVVTISTEASPTTKLVVIEITDDGIGMSPEEIGRVFQAFAQGDHASARGSHRFGGLGLGLAISKRVVELHLGRIHATSEGRDRGSTFSIELPLTEVKPAFANGAVQERIAPIKTSGEGGLALSVLLVEDHEPTRKTLERLLTRRGFQVVSVGTVAEGQRALAARPPDLLISDIGLPDGSGYSLMNEFRRHGGVGIALTGYGTEGDVGRAIEAGFALHITKPMQVKALDEALSTVVSLIGDKCGLKKI